MTMVTSKDPGIAAADLNTSINRHIDDRECRVPGNRWSENHIGMAQAATMMVYIDGILEADMDKEQAAGEVMASLEGAIVRDVRKSRWAHHVKGDYPRKSFDQSLDLVAGAAAPIITELVGDGHGNDKKNGIEWLAGSSLEDTLGKIVDNGLLTDNQATAILLLLREIEPSDKSQTDIYQKLKNAARMLLQRKITESTSPSSYHTLNLVVGRSVDSQQPLGIIRATDSHHLLKGVPLDKKADRLMHLLNQELAQLYRPTFM